jgi:hypothetical protein
MVPEELLGDSCERGENLNHGDSSEAREGSDIEGPAAARIECLKNRQVYVSPTEVSVKFLRLIFLGLVSRRFREIASRAFLVPASGAFQHSRAESRLAMVLCASRRPANRN